jgi:hypothetical protein
MGTLTGFGSLSAIPEEKISDKITHRWNVVPPRGKDDDQNWPPKAPIESITPSSRVYQHHRPKQSSIRRHPAAVSRAETV